MENRLDAGRVLNRIFELYGQQAGVLLGSALAVFLVAGLIAALLASVGPMLAIVGMIVVFAASTLYAGMVVNLVRDVQDGRRDMSVGELFQTVVPVLGALLVAAVLAGIGIGIGFVLLIVPGLFLATIWSVIAPVIVIERSGALAAFGRSRELVRGHGWQVFTVIIAVIAIVFVGALIAGAIGLAIGTAGRIVLEVVYRVAVAPIGALAAALIYFELIRLERLPQQAAEAGGQAGPPGGPLPGDPPPAGGPTPGT